jgi:hypothetical protein
LIDEEYLKDKSVGETKYRVYLQNRSTASEEPFIEVIFMARKKL